ncbi:hypothetical protein KDW_29560 [Dictyobacter vulcani]|uniref:Uncharacterized protein n=1 Tax=Dictyobacter vulcani TaxID=2607529 RepID=A0A5J4KH82_9CHLR|nr:hypothetical protein KDW_29560 [Dictyobacter vulcani]
MPAFNGAAKRLFGLNGILYPFNVKSGPKSLTVCRGYDRVAIGCYVRILSNSIQLCEWSCLTGDTLFAELISF